MLLFKTGYSGFIPQGVTYGVEFALPTDPTLSSYGLSSPGSFGSAYAISEQRNTLAIQSYTTNGNGAIVVYTNTDMNPVGFTTLNDNNGVHHVINGNNTWTVSQVILPPVEATPYRFINSADASGFNMNPLSLSSDGNTLTILAARTGSNKSYVLVYLRVNNVFTFSVAITTSAGTRNSINFCRLNTYGNIIVFNNAFDESTGTASNTTSTTMGAVYVYMRGAGDVWNLAQKIVPVANGESPAINGGRAIFNVATTPDCYTIAITLQWQQVLQSTNWKSQVSIWKYNGLVNWTQQTYSTTSGSFTVSGSYANPTRVHSLSENGLRVAATIGQPGTGLYTKINWDRTSNGSLNFPSFPSYDGSPYLAYIEAVGLNKDGSKSYRTLSTTTYTDTGGYAWPAAYYSGVIKEYVWDTTASPPNFPITVNKIIAAPTILSATHGTFYAKYFGSTNSISASGKTLISGTSQGSANKVFLTAL